MYFHIVQGYDASTLAVKHSMEAMMYLRRSYEFKKKADTKKKTLHVDYILPINN